MTIAPLAYVPRLVRGIQHLATKDAYRSDRRKDLLLQEHGYTVLRFLAEDVSKRLDIVLDTILLMIALCQSSEIPRNARDDEMTGCYCVR